MAETVKLALRNALLTAAAHGVTDEAVACADSVVDALLVENKLLREALAELIDAGQHPATMDWLGGGYTLSKPFVAALTHARKLLEVDDG